jgi:hypothetical protein
VSWCTKSEGLPTRATFAISVSSWWFLSRTMTRSARDQWRSPRLKIGSSSEQYQVSWMRFPVRQSFWIASPNRTKAANPLALASDARFAAGRPARMTYALVAVAMSGTHSIRVGFARRASINGPQPSASRAVDGRRIRSGCAFVRNRRRSSESGSLRSVGHGRGGRPARVSARP